MECQVKLTNISGALLFEFYRGVLASEGAKNICAVHNDNAIWIWIFYGLQESKVLVEQSH